MLSYSSPDWLDATTSTSEHLGDRFPVGVGREAHRLGELLHGDRLIPPHVGHAAQQRLRHVERVRRQSHRAPAPGLGPRRELRVPDHLVDHPRPSACSADSIVADTNSVIAL